MPTFITLVNFTRQGAEKVTDVPKRLAQARQLAERLGGSFDQWYLTMGRYDVVVIGQAPDDETMAAIVMGVGSLGMVRTETLRAFTEEEFQGLLDRMP